MILMALAESEILAQHLDDPDWVVFDCRHDLADPGRGNADYLKSHIPGARFAHLDDDLSGPRNGKNGRHPLPDPSALARMFGRAGVDSGKQVIAYDSQGSLFAARLWWLLRWLGHLPVAVLDGGWSQWTSEGRPQTAGVPAPRATQFSGQPDDSRVDAQQVLAGLGAPGSLLIDARAPDRFRGENETLDPVGGRIPGARNRYFRDNLDAEGRFKSPQQLATELTAALGDARPGQSIHYCGSGVSAAHNLLAMEIAGLHGARLYAGSWSEWCADPARPIATGEPRAGE